jgi:hypothetical protein
MTPQNREATKAAAVELLRTGEINRCDLARVKRDYRKHGSRIRDDVYLTLLVAHERLKPEERSKTELNGMVAGLIQEVLRGDHDEPSAMEMFG